jgi:hypothetical protein
MSSRCIPKYSVRKRGAATERPLTEGRLPVLTDDGLVTSLKAPRQDWRHQLQLVDHFLGSRVVVSMKFESNVT